MEISDKDIALRSAMLNHIALNPNHFGNLSELKIKGLPDAVFKKIGDTSFEELTCVGLNPQTDMLAAIVRIKQGGGYSGGPCTDGSFEYVRFFIDYGTGWVDSGMAAFNIHDLGFADDLCYAVSVKISPAIRRACNRAPVLPRVRAILSWNVAPPANLPDWHPVWGNRLERQVQIRPRNRIDIGIFDTIKFAEIEKINVALAVKLEDVLNAEPIAQLKPAALMDLFEKFDKADQMTGFRHVAPLVMQAAFNQNIAALNPQPLPPVGPDGGVQPDLQPLDITVNALDLLKNKLLLENFGIDLGKFGDFLANPDFNTDFEELHCVGLDRDLSQLHGIVQIKRASGYSGGLCSSGSQEYIAFYLDFGSGWEYQGTTSVTVHDVAVPAGGLWYQASLPVSLDKHRQEWCKTGRAKIRGILSWNAPPPVNQPDFIPHWGDREDCSVEVRPWPKDVIVGDVTPVLESIGNMPVSQIDGAGFAKGNAVGGAWSAYSLTEHLSPFGGTILLSGVIANAASLNLEYRVMVQAPGDGFHAFTDSFGVTVTEVSGSIVTFTSQTQTAIGDWFTYIPKTGPVFKSVAGNILAAFAATKEGLHRVFVEARDAATHVSLGTTAVHAFFVDNTDPVVTIDITSGGGNCSKFNPGDVLTGTYSMSDNHAGGLGISITPALPGNASPVITSKNGAPQFPVTSSLTFRTVPATDNLPTTGASGNWEVDSSQLQSCGYNIRIDGADRTILNSGPNRRRDDDLKGFCII